jgi:hypothetical protein
VSRRRVCKCGQPTWSQKGPYCHRCSAAALERRKTRTRPYAPKARVCEVCESSYIPNYSKQRSCGRKCGAVISSRRKVWPHSKVTPLGCRSCGNLFIARGNRKYCSSECVVEANRRCQREWYWERRGNFVVSICSDCGVEVARLRKKCDECLRRNRSDARRRAKARRALLRSEVTVERVGIRYVAERDQCRCGLCGGRVNMALRVPHPKAPTVDHVVPLSLGGSHTKANLQLAHFICNSLKGAVRGRDEQLRMVG